MYCMIMPKLSSRGHTLEAGPKMVFRKAFCRAGVGGIAAQRRPSRLPRRKRSVRSGHPEANSRIVCEQSRLQKGALPNAL
jgi:hypothetical protein